jgi:hypothetical protein
LNKKLTSAFLVWFWVPILVFSATPSPADSTLNAGKDSKSAKRNPSGEIQLEEIDIQGSVEKPSVTIVPKRIEPDLRELELNRSFEQEVKENVGEIPKSDEPLRKVEPVESIKKSVEKKRD